MTRTILSLLTALATTAGLVVVGAAPAQAAVPQTINFSNPGTQTYGTSPTLSATATSGLPVTFTSSTAGVCTITSGGVLTFVTAGTCTVNADQSGSAEYFAAPQVSRSFTVGAIVPGAPLLFSVTPGDTQASVAFLAPVSDGGSPITGYTVTTNPEAITVSGASSPIALSGLTNGMQYTVTVTATNVAGTGPASSALTVTPLAAQTITFANPGSQTFGTSPTFVATSDSGLTPTFTSSTTNVCSTTSGGSITFFSAGTCTINADQGGSASYLPATRVTRSFTVNAIAPSAPTITSVTPGDGQVTVSFAAPSNYGGSFITEYTVTTSPGGGTTTAAGSPAVITGLANGVAYTFTVAATNSAGTGPDSASSSAATPRGTQVITFANPGPQVVGTTPALTATSSAGLPVTFTSDTTGVCTVTTGGVLSLLTAGTCTINADQPGTAAVLPADQVVQAFAVNATTPSTPGSPSTGAGGEAAVETPIPGVAAVVPVAALPGTLTVTRVDARRASTRFTYAYDDRAPADAFIVVDKDGRLACSSGASRNTCTTTSRSGTFFAFARNSAGDGPRTQVVVPERAIVITGERRGDAGRRIGIDGVATGFSAGDRVIVYVRLAGQDDFTRASRRAVDGQGGISFATRAERKARVYVTSADGAVRSNTVVIAAG